MDLHSQGLDVVCTIRPPCEVRQVELNLVPAVIQPHGHGADEGLDSGGALVVACSEPSTNVLVIQYLHFEGKILLQVFDDHDKERQFNPQRLLRVRRTRDVCGADICPFNL